MSRTFNTPSPLNARDAYLREIQLALVGAILDIRAKEQQEILDGLILENTRLLDAHSRSFMFQSEFYLASTEFPNRLNNRTIHPSMLQPITEFIRDKDFNDAVQRSQVDNYVINTLLFAKHTKDLYALIPSKFHNILVNINADSFNIGPPATEEEIDKFKQKNRKGLLEFQRLFLESLIAN